MASVHLLDVQMEAAALSDTGSNSSVNTGICDQARYCLSAAHGKVTEAPVLRSGRCYFYLSLTDSGLTSHLNNNDKIQTTASWLLPLGLLLASGKHPAQSGYRRCIPLASRVWMAFPAAALPPEPSVLALCQLEVEGSAKGWGSSRAAPGPDPQPVLGSGAVPEPGPALGAHS